MGEGNPWRDDGNIPMPGPKPPTPDKPKVA